MKTYEFQFSVPIAKMGQSATENPSSDFATCRGQLRAEGFDDAVQKATAACANMGATLTGVNERGY